jgi:hypothetical protein
MRPQRPGYLSGYQPYTPKRLGSYTPKRLGSNSTQFGQAQFGGWFSKGFGKIAGALNLSAILPQFFPPPAPKPDIEYVLEAQADAAEAKAEAEAEAKTKAKAKAAAKAKAEAEAKAKAEAKARAAKPPPPPPPPTPRPPLSLVFKGSCPRTHFKATDHIGDFCKPCPPGTLFHGGQCKSKPPACPCNLKRIGDPDFGKCPPPPTGCGPPPKSQKCNVKGQGLMNSVCKCGKWVCPTNKDILIAKFQRMGKALPKGIAPPPGSKPRPKPKAKPKAKAAKPKPKPKPKAKPKAPAKAKPKLVAKPKPMAGADGFGDYKKPLIGLTILGIAVAAYFLLTK